MNIENQQQEAESEVISVDIEEQEAPQAEIVSEEVVADSDDSDDSTIVRNNSDDSNELESYSENVQKRINQLTAKRKQAMEEAEAAYNYAEQMKAKNEEMRKRLEDLDKGYINEYGSRVETQEAAVKKRILTKQLMLVIQKKLQRPMPLLRKSLLKKKGCACKSSFRATSASSRRAATAANTAATPSTT